MQTLYIIYDPKNEKVLHQTYNEIMAKHKTITYLIEKLKPIMIEIDKNKIKSDSFYVLYDIKNSKIITIEKYLNEILDYIRNIRHTNTKKSCLKNCRAIKVDLREEF